MTDRQGSWVLAFTLLAAAVFVVATGINMPPLVASHFDLLGYPTGFMPRVSYLGIMLILVLGFPLVLLTTTYRATSGSDSGPSIPNREYWLHPHRRAITVEYLRRAARFLAAAVAVFFATVHGLIVHASAQPPVKISPFAFPGAMTVLFLVVGVRVVALVRSLRRGA